MFANKVSRHIIIMIIIFEIFIICITTHGLFIQHLPLKLITIIFPNLQYIWQS